MKEKTFLNCIEKTKETNFLVDVNKIDENIYNVNIKCKSCNNEKNFNEHNIKSIYGKLRLKGERSYLNCKCKNRFKIIQTFCINKNFILLDEFEKVHDKNVSRNNSKNKLKFKCKICNYIYYKTWDSIRRKDKNGCQNCAFISYKGVSKGKGIFKKIFNSELYTRQERSNRLIEQNLDISILKDDPLYEAYIIDSFNYNIDHIFPRMAFIDFNMDNMFDYGFLKTICNCRENLQILSKTENVQKRSEYNKKEFLLWVSNKL